MTTKVRGAGEVPLTDAQLAQMRRVLDGVTRALDRVDAMPWRQRVRWYISRNPDATETQIANACGVSRKKVIECLTRREP